MSKVISSRDSAFAWASIKPCKAEERWGFSGKRELRVFLLNRFFPLLNNGNISMHNAKFQKNSHARLAPVSSLKSFFSWICSGSVKATVRGFRVPVQKSFPIL